MLGEASALARSPVFADRCRALALARSANRDGAWWTVKAKQGHACTVLVFGTIDDASLEKFITAADAATHFTIEIDCVGGNGSQALPLGRLLAERGNATGLVVGSCKSAACFVLAGCARRFATANAAFMVHSIKLAAFGDANELRQRADWLETSTAEAAAVFAAQTGIALATSLAWWTGCDLYFTATEALAAGLVQEIVPAAASDNAPHRTPHETPDDLQLAIELCIGLRHLTFADKESVRTWLRPLVDT